MAPPLYALFGMAVVAGVGFTLGRRLVTKVIEPNWKDNVEPWLREQAESFNQWGRGRSPDPRAGRDGHHSDTETTAGTEGAAPTTASPDDGSDAPPPR